MGPDIFSKYVEENYTHYFLGNTDENLLHLKNKLEDLGHNLNNCKFQSLPYKSVGNFDYQTIANEIQLFLPDIIWVSLVAPQ